MCKTRVMLTVMLKSFFSCFHQSTPYHIVVITCNVVHLLRWFEVGIVLLNEKHAELCRRQRCRMSVFFFRVFFNLYICWRFQPYVSSTVWSSKSLWEPNSDDFLWTCSIYDWIWWYPAGNSFIATWQTSSWVMWVRQWIHFTRYIILINFGWEFLKTHSEFCNPLPF